MQNKCIRFCMNLGNRHHISANDFKEINWLPTKERFEQCVCVSTFKFWKEKSPVYMYDIYNKMVYTHGTRKSYLRLELPSINTFSGKKGLSYIGPRLWNDLSFDLKVCNGRGGGILKVPDIMPKSWSFRKFREILTTPPKLQKTSLGSFRY